METNRNRRLDITKKSIETEEKQNKDFSPTSALKQIQEILKDKDHLTNLRLMELYHEFPQERKEGFVVALVFELGSLNT